MTRYLLLALFFIMLSSAALNLDLSLVPGVSIKNALLYLVGSLIIAESAMLRNRRLESLSVIAPFGLLFVYALLTWLIVILLLDYPHYDARNSLLSLKGKLADQFLMFLVFFYGVQTRRDALWLVKGILWVVILGNVITVLDTFNLPDLGIITTREDGRVEGIIGGANEFAGFLTFFLPAIVALWSAESGFRRRLAALGFFFSVVALLTTASRGAFFALMGGSLFAGLYLRRWISVQFFVRSVTLGLIMGFLAMGVLALTDYRHLIEERLTQGVGTGSGFDMSSGRSMIWYQAVREMADVPLTFLTGFGWDAYYNTAGTRFATHNVYLDYFYNLGLIGLVLFVSVIGSIISNARRAYASAQGEAPFTMALVFGMVCFAFAMTFNDLQWQAVYVWGFAGVAMRLATASSTVAGTANAHTSVGEQGRVPIA